MSVNANNYKYHMENEQTKKLYPKIRAKGKEFAELIDSNVPPCRELAIAQTKIEEAIMWANAAVARNIGG